MTTLASFTPIGANLLPAKVLADRKQTQRRRRWVAVIASATLGSAVFVSLPTNAARDLATLQASRDALSADLASLREAVVAQHASAVDLHRDLAVRTRVSSRLDWTGLLASVAAAASGAARLDALTISPVTGGGESAAHFQVTMSGEVASLEDASRFIIALEELPVFSRIELVSTSRSPEPGAPARFAITGEIKPAPATPDEGETP